MIHQLLIQSSPQDVLQVGSLTPLENVPQVGSQPGRRNTASSKSIGTGRVGRHYASTTSFRKSKRKIDAIG